MEAIKAAIARRSGGGSGASPLNTQGAPMGATPTGGPSTPTVQPTPTPAPQPASPGNMTQGAPQTPQAPQATPNKPGRQVANFDDETRNLAKQLISKLMNAI